jgi:hypothetical protein
MPMVPTSIVPVDPSSSIMPKLPAKALGVPT